MKKSTLLSLLTATSIVLTSAGTYAAWDKTSVNKSAEVTFRNPVTIAVDGEYKFNDTKELDKTPKASSDVTFSISNPDKLADTLTLTPVITGDTGKINTGDFTIEIKEKDKAKLGGNAEDGFTADIKEKTTATYTVEVTPKNVDDASVTKIAGKAVTVQLEAKLSKSPSPLP